MSNLSEISIDKIETDVMSILYSNIDNKFTQFQLFNKLIEDKYELEHTQHTNSLHPNFKSKYLLVIRTLMSKYDDIEVEKKDGIYYVMCKNSNIDINNKDKVLYNENITNNILLEKSDISNMYDYIYDNNLSEFMNWSDPFDGNSIYHELIFNNNLKQTSRLLDENKFNFEIKNNQNQTPIDLINSSEMSNLIIAEFVKKMSVLMGKYNQEKLNVINVVNDFNKKVDYYESDEYKSNIISTTTLWNFMMEKTRKYHYAVKIYFVSFLICYISIRMII